jgi:hypothetical protein
MLSSTMNFRVCNDGAVAELAGFSVSRTDLIRAGYRRFFEPVGNDEVLVALSSDGTNPRISGHQAVAIVRDGDRQLVVWFARGANFAFAGAGLQLAIALAFGQAKHSEMIHLVRFIRSVLRTAEFAAIISEKT